MAAIVGLVVHFGLVLEVVLDYLVVLDWKQAEPVEAVDQVMADVVVVTLVEAAIGKVMDLVEPSSWEHLEP